MSCREQERLQEARCDVVCFSEYAFWPADRKLTTQEIPRQTEVTQAWLSDFSSRCEGLDVVFLPLISPDCQTDTEVIKAERDQAFQTMAKRAGAAIVKISWVGDFFGGKTLGRSLVIAKDGEILLKPKGEHREAITWCTV